MRISLLKPIPPPPSYADISANPEQARQRFLTGYRTMIWNGRVLALFAVLSGTLILLVCIRPGARWYNYMVAGVVFTLNVQTLRSIWREERFTMRAIDHLEEHAEDWLSIKPPIHP